jgi:hypothetical protein
MEAIRVIDRQARNTTTVFCGEVFCLFLIGLVHLHSAAPRVTLAVSSLVVLVLAVRAGCSYMLVVEPGQLTTRSVIRTRSWNYGELLRAELSGSEAGSKGSFIVLESKSGKRYSLKAFSQGPDSSSLTARTVREINARICSCHALWQATTTTCAREKTAENGPSLDWQAESVQRSAVKRGDSSVN